ncbi:phage tail tape measure protein [Paracoccus beibuensis]|uniref:hypothetical protein n=1 Tax=Paracoccus beibuensis TaxID=547602 RepID=UPI00223ECC6F|nr:hypothetical protein [Paracoccus beibuensis]
MATRSSKPVRIPFLADVQDALADLKELDQAVEAVGTAAQQADRELGEIGDDGAAAARKVETAFRDLYVVSEETAEQTKRKYREAYEAIAEAGRRGERSADEVKRAYISMEKGIEKVNERLVRDTETKFDRMVSNISGKLKSVGTRITAGVTAGITAAATGGVMAMQNLNQKIIDVKNAADVAGVSMREFQRWTAAGANVGLEFEDISSMLKDMGDRIGDLAQAESGPLVDWMERVAPKIGLVSKSIVGDTAAISAETKRLFGNLSSTEALQLYVSGLDKANLSQHDFRFFMEAIAGDSTKLLPLLKDNGKALKELADAAEARGAFFDEEDVKKARELQAANAQLASSFQALGIALMEAGVHDAIITIVQAVASFITFLANNVSPGVLKFVAILGMIALAVGPILVAIGFMMTALGGVSIAAVGIGAAFLAVAGAVAAIVYAVAKNWNAITNLFGDGMRWVQDNWHKMLLNMARAVVNTLLAPIRGVIKAFNWVQRQRGGREVPVPGFRSGGYTGDVAEDEEAGVVHGQEFVVRAPMVRKFGRGFFEALNRGLMPPTVGARLSGSQAVSRPASSGTPVNVHLDGESYSMRAEDDVAARFLEHARKKAARRSGSTPGFVGA